MRVTELDLDYNQLSTENTVLEVQSVIPPSIIHPVFTVFRPDVVIVWVWRSKCWMDVFKHRRLRFTSVHPNYTTFCLWFLDMQIVSVYSRDELFCFQINTEKKQDPLPEMKPQFFRIVCR